MIRIRQAGIAIALALASYIHGEPYIGIHGGYVCPMSLSNVLIAGANIVPGTSSSSIHYKGAGMYGGTLGYYSDGVPYVGLAVYVDVFKSGQKDQNLTVTSPAWGSIIGIAQRMNVGTGSLGIIESDLLFMARYPQDYAEPYMGIGVAVIAAKRTLDKAVVLGQTIDFNVSSHAIAPGLNFRVGGRFIKKYHFSPYIEYSLTWSQLTFFPKGGYSASGISGVQGTYLSNTILGGLSYDF